MKPSLVFTIILSLGLVSGLQAQDRPYRYYATQEVMARLEKEDPELAKKRAQIERTAFQERSKISGSEQITIPVVFHVLYSEALPSLREEGVLAQLASLNADFSMDKKSIKHPADTLEKFIDRVAKVDINFCLAKEDPSGKKAAAVRFIKVSKNQWQSDDAMKSAKTGGVDPWNPQQYLNIWVVPLPDGMAGYAQMPGGPILTDGIVINSSFFGTGTTVFTPYNQGKTLTHLIGSYLNLYELWNDYIPCADDYVEDTPIHNAPNIDSPTYKHVSTCYDNPVEMTMNFMDNTDDAALTMFTIGQKARMLANLGKDGPRAGLLEAKTKCDNNGNLDAPIALNLPIEEKRNEEALRVNLFPNPTAGDFTLELDSQISGQLSIVVYSTLGAVVQQLQRPVVQGLQQVHIPSKDWAPGLYLVHTQVNEHKNVQRLIIAKN